MKFSTSAILATVATLIAAVIAAPGNGRAEGESAEEGFVPIFNGENLDGWEGDDSLWRVEDGAIVGETTEDAPIDYNRFLAWTLGQPDDFELKLEYKLRNGNSGVQVRSFPRGQPHALAGYQADIDETLKFSGICYGEGFRGILAKRGEVATVGENGKPAVTGSVGDADELAGHIDADGWNEYHIIARGNHLVFKINGHTMSETIDEDSDVRRRGGLIGFQLHKGPAMKISFRNIRLKRLPLDDVAKVVFIAGKPSHPPRTHEHNAGCLLLSDLLNTHHADKIHSTVYTNGWPSDPTAFDHADAVVIYADGGKRHPAYFHLKTLAELRERGVGIGAIHYAVEMEPGETNDELIRCIGGAFEIDHSVNPHWTAEFENFPTHPVARGVAPFTSHDEWYFNMRFPEGMKGVSPVLSAVPPEETMSRPDGHHSGNPTVRKMVAAGKDQHLCWVTEREDGGRGFGFTGGHFHDNWADDDFRTTVLNAIAWTAGAEIPEDGLATPTPTKEQLDANLDPKPDPKKKRNQKRKKAPAN